MCPKTNVWLCIFIIFNIIMVLHSLRMWTDHSVPRFSSYKIPDHAISTTRSIVQRKIVDYHNFFRTKVQPPASDMLAMSWHREAAQQAQSYAEQCKFLKHNPPEDKVVHLLGSCGQNLFVSNTKVPWFFAIKSWYIEYKNFTYGSPRFNIHSVGHYTQMVWSTSHKVGCGVASCAGGPWGSYYNYVCHYCPGGNYLKAFPFPYKAGRRCGDCPNQCTRDGLCKNACNARDEFLNCNDLAKGTKGNICFSGLCNATCSCATKIHKIYPWK